jgi:hypothetical protein
MDWLVPEWLLALSLTLFLLDIVLFQTEVLTWAGISLLSGWIVWRVEFASGVWSVVSFIVFVFFFSIVYYVFFRATIGKFVRRTFNRNSPDEIQTKIVGAHGHIHYVDGKPYFRWNGEELLPINIEESSSLEEGRAVTVASFANGDVTVH